MKCKVCGKRFPLLKEKRYLATDRYGLSDVLSGGAVKYECFDCPSCGCQIVIQPYKEPVKAEPEAMELTEALKGE